MLHNTIDAHSPKEENEIRLRVEISQVTGVSFSECAASCRSVLLTVRNKRTWPWETSAAVRFDIGREKASM
jgi:hypothetical protein